MEEVQLIIRDRYNIKDKKGNYIAHIIIGGKLNSVLKKDIDGCENRVQLLVKSIMECINTIDEPSNFSIITLINWGVTLIRKEDGNWIEGKSKKLEDSKHKDTLLELKSLMESKGHKISSYCASRNMVLDSIVLDDDNVTDTYINFKVKRDIKKKFEELCYSKGVDTEKVLNKLLINFLKRNT